MKRRNLLLTVLMVLTAGLFIGPIAVPTTTYAAQKTVDHNQPLKKDEFMEPVEGYTFKVSDKVETYEYNRFTLTVAPGMYVSEQCVSVINEIMDLIEKTTGCSFYPENKYGNPYFIDGKVNIDLEHRHMTDGGLTIEYAHEGGVTLMDDEALVGEFTDTYSTIIHELLHVAQLRNYGDLGNIVTEGFAESYTGTIEKILKDKYGYKIRTNERENEISCINAYGINECNLDVDYDVNWVTADNVEKYFFLEPGHSGHEPSYWIVEYIRERYGDDGFKKLMDALAKRWVDYVKTEKTTSYINLPNTIELEVIKATLSDNFVREFYDWFKRQNIKYDTTDCINLTGVDKIDAPLGNVIVYSGIPYMDSITNFNYKGTLEIDYSRAYALLQQVYGYNVKGISGSFSGVGRVDFYDQYGTWLYGFGSEYMISYQSVHVPYATKVVIKNSGGISNYSIYSTLSDSAFCDIEFSDVACNNGRTVTFEEIKKKELTTLFDIRNGGRVQEDYNNQDNNSKDNKPVSKKVKTFEQLSSALKSAQGRGGTITVTANITVDDYLVIPVDTKVTIKKGKKLTLKDTCISIRGSLSGNSKSIVFDYGWLWLEENATWKYGNYTFTSKVKKDYPENASYACGIRIDEWWNDGKLNISYGFYNRLYITAPKGTKLEKLLHFEDLREGFTPYLNKKKISAKKMKTLTIK